MTTSARPAKEAFTEGVLDDAALAVHPTAFAPDLLRGQVVVIFGAGGSLGRASAWLAARLGAHVVLTNRTKEKVDSLSALIEEKGYSAEAFASDIRDRESVDAIYKHIWDTHKRLDIVIHSAGGQFPGAAIDFTLKGWRAVINTNLEGTFNVMQEAARGWRDHKAPGSIVNIITSPQNLHHVAHSNAARAGVKAFSEAVAVEWAPLGIRVNCVAPGLIRTAGWATYEPHVRERYPNGNPLRRVGTSWDIAEGCIYVGGPAGNYQTGTTLEIGGGGHLWGEVWTTDKPMWFREASRAYDVDAPEK